MKRHGTSRKRESKDKTYIHAFIQYYIEFLKNKQVYNQTYCTLM